MSVSPREQVRIHRKHVSGTVPKKPLNTGNVRAWFPPPRTRSLCAIGPVGPILYAPERQVHRNSVRLVRGGSKSNSGSGQFDGDREGKMSDPYELGRSFAQSMLDD